MAQKQREPIEGTIVGSGTDQVVQDDAAEESDKSARYPWLKPTQWVKGKSGNPQGRPPDLLLRELRRQLQDPTVVEQIVRVLVARAAAGDMKALGIIWDRTAGRLSPTSDTQIVAATHDGFVGIKVLKGVDPEAV